jgi:hypothetical protein
VFEATSTHAVVLTYDFTVNFTSGSLLGQEFEGFFSYDDSAIEESQLTLFYRSVLTFWVTLIQKLMAFP